MEAAKIPFEILEVDVDEIYPKDLPINEVPEYLARLKAKAAASIVKAGILITADTVVIFDNKILGKPKDAIEAKKMIRNLSGKVHIVITGVCIVENGEMQSFSNLSKVTLHDLTDHEIDFYIKEFKPFDKAGSYGIQDWIGWVKIKSIEGSYANVMGLPIDQLYHLLITL